AATVLLQWAGGGLLYLWVTTRRREVGLGYGWLLRGTYGLMALGALAAGLAFDPVPVRDVAAGLTAGAAAVALAVPVQRRKAGVAGQRAEAERRKARVAAMVGEKGENPSGLAETGIEREEQDFDAAAAEFPPSLDLVAPAIALVGIVAGAVHAAPAG